MNRAALFDVDGTLADTNHLHVTCWWEALRQGGHDVAMHDIHRAIGLPGEDLLAHLLGEHHDTGRDDTLTAAHDTLYGTYFDRLPPLDAAADLLRELDRRGWRVVLVTSAQQAELDALRRAVDADDAITATAGADDVEAPSDGHWPALQRRQVRRRRPPPHGRSGPRTAWKPSTAHHGACPDGPPPNSGGCPPSVCTGRSGVDPVLAEPLDHGRVTVVEEERAAGVEGG
ncbi:HAD family hydrolase, partial [Streptomyces sp. NPDC002082]|uniref:HAD family hydrolase n=1 Tax=Streptomyces sp. NPDC002082 TaxID=3154772 RepID=UPI0033185F60